MRTPSNNHEEIVVENTYEESKPNRALIGIIIVAILAGLAGAGALFYVVGSQGRVIIFFSAILVAALTTPSTKTLMKEDQANAEED